jgi:hypothetical protein
MFGLRSFWCWEWAERDLPKPDIADPELICLEATKKEKSAPQS